MKDTIVPVLIILLLLAVLSLQFLQPTGGGGQSPIPPEQTRRFAATLESQELYKQAIDHYRIYLDTANVPDVQRANILYNIGVLYLEKLEDYENALAVFLEISHLYPQTPIVRDAEKRMVTCYEGMRRGFDAQKKLQNLTDLEPDEEEKGTGPVVAKIGDRTITLDQLERELAGMMPGASKQPITAEQKLTFLRSKIFQDLLYDMAVRKEYNKDREVRKRIREAEKSLLAQKIYAEEVQDKVKVSSGDVELYYKANPDEFKTPLSVQTAHIQVESQEKANEVKKAIDEGMTFEEAVKKFSTDERTKGTNGSLGSIYQGRDTIPGIGSTPEIVQAILALKEGAISEPLESPKGVHLFRAVKITPEIMRTLEESHQTAEYRVKQRKEQEFQQELMEHLLKSEKVQIFEQVIMGQSPQPRNPAPAMNN